MARQSSLLGRKKNKLRLKKTSVNSISAILLFAAAFLIWVSFFRQGLLLTQVNNWMQNILGTIPSLVLPLSFITGGLMVTKFKSPIAQTHVFLGTFLLVPFLAGLVRQGDLGMQIWLGTKELLSPVGAFIFLLAGLGISLIVAFNIPFEDVLNLLFKFFKSIFSAPSRIKNNQLSQNQPIKISGMTSSPPTGKSKIDGKDFSHDKNLPTATEKNTSPSTPSFIPSNVPAATDYVWRYPPFSLLSENISGKADRGNINANAAKIEETLEAFGITAKVVEINYGPAVTQYSLDVAIGTKLSKINALSNDLALALAAPTGQIRIEAPIPGRSLVGIELPNRSPEFVSLRKILESDPMKNHKSKLAVALGLDVSGQPLIADIARMPHAIIAGATGSGKSVCINAFIASLLFRTSPQELNLILVDPKRVELTGYNGIPHLLTPVIVEPDKVLSALKWAMSEMDRRYKLFAEVGVRNLEGYNEQAGFQALPYIVIFIDELADIMLFAPVEVEDAVTRIAQMARATGIHLVIATQRPSVDIITGLIKANIPTRIAFAVSSMIDSRVVIDQPGAEKLLGKGDMLYLPPDQAKPARVQGAFIADKEIRQLIEFIKHQGVAPQYTEEIVTTPTGIIKSGKGRMSGSLSSGGEGGDRDSLFEESFRMIVSHNTASASFLQRKLSIGYARAARILDELHQAGIIGPVDGAKPREILITDVDAFLNSSPPAT